LRTFGWVILISLSLAVAGGLLLSSRFLKRIDAINRTAEAIIEGDIRQRIPRRAAPDDLDRLAATLNRMLDRTNDLMDSLAARDQRYRPRFAHTARASTQSCWKMRRPPPLRPPNFKSQRSERSPKSMGLLGTFSAILRIAQIESGSRRAGFKTLSLSALVQDVFESFADSAEDVGKSLHADIAPDVFLQGDHELLVQALVNLVENALVHSPQGTVVTLGLTRDGDHLRLSVADNGPGVPAQDRARIFQRFVRLERSRSTAGNGLGLSIVAAVAGLHGGSVSATDNHPGLRVELDLPATSPAA
jgi:signal transduction histidine kinase